MLRQSRTGARQQRYSERQRGLAEAVIDRSMRAGAQLYDRNRDLPRLILIDPPTDVGESPTELELIVVRLQRALRAERNRARVGHWTYDLNRHIALHQAYLAESERLAVLKGNRHYIGET